ncbi:MAG: Zn-ribbon domain-containing OB-fold protein [Anaerolineales bacterium]|nr:Zn-ribbon domain-containing OB-fold protein [Anaerolineales bacterium]HEY62914.1 Zn-ribbon domain-containing OB-fold protein [Anaerolineae bacterium]
MNEKIQRPFTASSFNQFLQEQKLMGTRCEKCNALFIPPRAICAKCRSDQMTWVEFSGKGKLAAFTSVNIGLTFMNAQGFDRKNPYQTGIVELEEGVMISARLLGFNPQDPASIKIGAPMHVEFLEIGEGEEKRMQLAFRVD